MKLQVNQKFCEMFSDWFSKVSPKGTPLPLFYLTSPFNLFSMLLCLSLHLHFEHMQMTPQLLATLPMTSSFSSTQSSLFIIPLLVVKLMSKNPPFIPYHLLLFHPFPTLLLLHQVLTSSVSTSPLT